MAANAVELDSIHNSIGFAVGALWQCKSGHFRVEYRFHGLHRPACCLTQSLYPGAPWICWSARNGASLMLCSYLGGGCAASILRRSSKVRSRFRSRRPDSRTIDTTCIEASSRGITTILSAFCQLTLGLALLGHRKPPVSADEQLVVDSG